VIIGYIKIAWGISAMQQTEVKADFKVLTVTSESFASKTVIPRKFTCEGEDVNPPLDIGGIPEETKSIVLIVEDPDAPSGTWLHWLVWNIPVTHHIHENEIPGDQGLNDFGRNIYGGPCPPSGTHRYFFKIYALDDLLDLPEGSLRKDVEDAMLDHIVAYGELEGRYKRTRK
jgi:Raf kinase inhibitor-like YbhB/YbcL family protein